MSFRYTCDHHKMVLTVMKSTFSKASPKIIHYRNYSKFDNRRELLKVNDSDMDYETFEDNLLVP